MCIRGPPSEESERKTTFGIGKAPGKGSGWKNEKTFGGKNNAPSGTE